MSTALRGQIGPTTIEDWLTHEDPEDGSRIELIRGYLQVTPSPSGQHQHSSYWLARVIDDALRAARRTDLHMVQAVGVKISTRRRTGLIPDVLVMNRVPFGTVFQAEDVVLAVEVWSPGNRKDERQAKVEEYALAGVRYLWEVRQDRFGACTVTASYLEDGRYVEELTARAGETVTVKAAAPVPITFDPGKLDL